MQGKRESEKGAILNQYVTLSKLASRTLILLIIYCIYFGSALMDRQDAINDEIHHPKVVDVISDSFLNSKNLNFSWANYEGFYENDNYVEHFFKERQKIPILNIEMSGEYFFYAGPLVFLIITVIYWIYLSNANKVFMRLKWYLQPNEKLRNLTYPWFYNLQIRTIWLKASWELFLEVFPILISMIIFVAYLPSFKNLFNLGIVYTSLYPMTFVFYVILFDIKIVKKSNYPSIHKIIFTSLGYLIILTLLMTFAHGIIGIENNLNMSSFFQSRPETILALVSILIMSFEIIIFGNFPFLVFVSLTTLLAFLPVFIIYGIIDLITLFMNRRTNYLLKFSNVFYRMFIKNIQIQGLLGYYNRKLTFLESIK